MVVKKIAGVIGGVVGLQMYRYRYLDFDKESTRLLAKCS